MFFYISSVVPAIWFLELHEMENRIAFREEQKMFNATNTTLFVAIPINQTVEDLSINIGEIGVSVLIYELNMKSKTF